MNPEILHLEAGIKNEDQYIGSLFDKLDNLFHILQYFKTNTLKSSNTQSCLLLELFVHFFDFNLLKVGN